MNLWDWSVRAYAAPGVAEACLHLQDAHGQSVPLLLWGGWMARTGRAMDEDTAEAACDTARAWETSAVAPLRLIRRTLKAPIPDISDPGREAIRARIKAVELEAERALLADLEALSPEQGSVPTPPVAALVQTAKAWSPIVPRPALVDLAERLPA